MTKNFTVQRKSLAEEVALTIQGSIAAGEYKVGSKLPSEPELMRIYGVGRSTVREAIRVLANAGMLSVKQGSGTMVMSKMATNEPISSRMKRAPSGDLDEIRQILEMKIAEKAALKRTNEDIIKIEKSLEKIEEADDSGDLERCIDTDIDFHAAIAEASHNRILLELYLLASEHLRHWYRKIYTTHEVFATALDLHKRLFLHIKLGESKKAWDVAEKIIKHGRV